MPTQAEITQKGHERKVIFFGCPLDSDEKDDSIQEKLSINGPGEENDDPYSFIMDLIRQEVDSELWEEKGSIDVPGWLRPIPLNRENIIVDNFVAFIDDDGCRTYAEMVGELVSDIFPDVPCMLAIDHSLTGGAFRRLVELYSPEDISLIVLDSHLDALPISILSGAIQYDIETNPNSVYDRNDPFIRDRPESYNASSFLYHLLEEEVVEPGNMYVIGISDYPPKRSFRIKDQRIKRYVGLYSGLRKKGVRIVTKKDLLVNPSTIRTVFRQIETPYVYISIDMDIGARNAMEGVRFRNWQGINEKQIYRIADNLCDLLSGRIQIAGMDLTEINPRRAGLSYPSGNDRTYRIAANLIRKLVFGHSVSNFKT